MRTEWGAGLGIFSSMAGKHRGIVAQRPQRVASDAGLAS